MAENKITVAKDRSPNFPAVPLGEAVPWAKKLFVDAKKNAVPVEVVAKATGSEAKKGVSGPARQKIAAMRQYALIDSAGHGQYKLSPVGIDLGLHSPSDPEYREALKRAALSPTIFGELYAKYDELPNDHILAIMLRKDRDFSEDGARRFIKAFRDTLSFAGLDKERYDPGNSGLQDSELIIESSADNKGGRVSQELWDAFYGRPPEKKRVVYTWPLPDGTDVQVAFQQRPTAKGVERVITFLNIIKDDLQNGGVDAGWVPTGPTPKVTPRILPEPNRPLREIEAEDDDNEAGLP